MAFKLPWSKQGNAPETSFNGNGNNNSNDKNESGSASSNQTPVATPVYDDEKLPRYHPLRLFPVLRWLPKYEWKQNLLRDLLAGIIVGCMAVPQAMGYAKVAGIPLQNGLYSDVTPLFFYFVFGTSRQLIIGPTAATSVLLTPISESAVKLYQKGDIHSKEDYAAMAGSLTALIAGIFLIGLFLFRLSIIADFLSHSVLLGFTSGVAITIFSTQCKSMLGIPIPESPYPLYSFGYALQNLAKTSPYAVTFFILAVLFLVSTRELGRFLYKKIKKLEQTAGTKKATLYFLRAGFVFCSLNALWAIIICTGVSAALYAGNKKLTTAQLPIVGKIPQGMPAPVAPNVTALEPIIPSLIGNAIVVAILAFVEAYSLARKVAETKGYAKDLDAGQELLALGLSNFLCSFFGGFSVSGSYSRSMVNEKSGATSAISSFTVGLIVLLAVYAISPALYYLPSACLAAVICVAAGSLIDIGEFNRVRKVAIKDFLTAIITFCATIALGPALGFLIGFCISFATLLQISAFPHIAVLGWMFEKDSTGASKVVWRNPKRFKEAKFIDEVAVLRLDAPLWFGNSEMVLERFFKESRGKKLLVLDCSAISSIDLTGLRALSALEERTKQRTGASVVIANVNDSVRDAINKFNTSYGAVGATSIGQANVGTDGTRSPNDSPRADNASQIVRNQPSSHEEGIVVYHSVVDALLSHGYHVFGDVEGGTDQIARE